MRNALAARRSQLAEVLRRPAAERRAAFSAFLRYWTDVPRLWHMSQRAYARRRNLFFIGFIGTIALIIIVGAIAASFPKELVTRTFIANGLNYDYLLAKSPEFAVHTFGDVGQGASRDVSVAFDFKAATDGKTCDIFQTAPLNDGIRLEYSLPGTLAMVVNSDVPPGYKVFLAPGVSAGQWHRFRTSLTHDGHVQISIDGLVEVDTSEPALNYSVRDVVLGRGFDASRTFTGAVHDATIDVRFFEPNGAANSPIWRILMALLFIYNLYFLVLMGDSVRAEVVGSEASLGSER
jgi:hypothetical protein